jgi:hypothetical protein
LSNYTKKRPFASIINHKYTSSVGRARLRRAKTGTTNQPGPTNRQKALASRNLRCGEANGVNAQSHHNRLYVMDRFHDFSGLACVAHKSLEICDRCKLRQQNSSSLRYGATFCRLRTRCSSKTGGDLRVRKRRLQALPLRFDSSSRRTAKAGAFAYVAGQPPDPVVERVGRASRPSFLLHQIRAERPCHSAPLFKLQRVRKAEKDRASEAMAESAAFGGEGRCW